MPKTTDKSRSRSAPALARAETSGDEQPTAKVPLSPELLRKMDAYWRASNYLSVGQIYLLANPLLKKSLKREHTKPRLLGHWGTTPGLNFIYVHLNRVIERYGDDMPEIRDWQWAGAGKGRKVDTSADNV